MKRTLLLFILTFLCVHSASSRGGFKEGLHKGKTENASRIFTGNLATDLFTDYSSFPLVAGEFRFPLQEEVVRGKSPKSPLLAAFLSAAIPGAGEFYSESYLKGGAFFAAELISWVVNIAYNRKGDRATTDFQNFADMNWSVVDYASWVNENKGCTIEINPDKNLPAWRRVNWAQLNECERGLGGYFSHTLPPYGDQQYYELIGKYPQYNPGWRDADRSQDISDRNISALFKEYSKMRGRANDLYDIASTALLVVVVNHVLSAADAAWSATRYNSVHARVEMKLHRTPFGAEVVPMATVRVSW